MIARWKRSGSRYSFAAHLWCPWNEDWLRYALGRFAFSNGIVARCAHRTVICRAICTGDLPSKNLILSVFHLCAFLISLLAFPQISSATLNSLNVPGFSAPTLTTDGRCISTNPSGFSTIRTENVAPLSTRFYYLIDGNNIVLDNVPVSGAGLTLAAIELRTNFTPASGPFRIVATDTDNIAIGLPFTGTPVLRGDITFDPKALDPDCLSPTAQQRSQTVTSLQNAFNSVTPSALGGLGLDGPGAGANGNGITFAPTGLSFNRSNIDAANPLDRDYGAAFGPQGYFARQGTSRHRNNGFNFSMNLQQMAANAQRKEREEAEKLGIYRSGSKDGPYQPRSRWVSSVSGRYVEFDDDQTNADRDGSLWYVTSALGYRFSDTTTAGVFTRYREGEVDSVALASSLDSELWGGGVYLATTGAGGMRFIGSALYEQGENDITISGATGDFDNETISLEASLDKRITRGRTWIEPALSFLYHKSDNDNFTDSAGNFVLGETNVLGRLTYGSRVGTTLGGNGRAAIKPYAKINGIWDYETEDTITASTGALLKTGEHAISLGGGLDIMLVNGIALRVAGDWFTYDTELQGWSISGGIGGSFAAFGLAGVAPGFVSLDLSSNGEDASATARIRIPLGGAQ